MAQLLDNVCDKLHLHRLEHVPLIQQLSEKTKLKPAHIGLIGLGVFALLLLLECGAYWIAFLAGFLYPAWASYKAIETRSRGEDALWLTYWTVFGFVQVFDKLVFSMFRYIPFYSMLKIALFIYLYHPKTQGALVLYTKVIRPNFLNYEGEEYKKEVEELAQKKPKTVPTKGADDFDVIKKDE